MARSQKGGFAFGTGDSHGLAVRKYNPSFGGSVEVRQEHAPEKSHGSEGEASGPNGGALPRTSEKYGMIETTKFIMH